MLRYPAGVAGDLEKDEVNSALPCWDMRLLPVCRNLHRLKPCRQAFALHIPRHPSPPPSALCRLSATLLASGALTLMPGWGPTTCTALRSGSGWLASSQPVRSGWSGPRGSTGGDSIDAHACDAQ